MKELVIIRGPVTRKCGRHGDYVDDGVARCMECGQVGILVGKA